MNREPTNNNSFVNASVETPAGFFRGAIECGENGPDDIICVETTSLARNSEVPLKIGDVYSYEFVGTKDTDLYTVEGIERVNGSDCFIVRRDYSFTGPSDTIYSTNRLCFDKITGEVKKADLGYMVDSKVAEFLTSDTWFFAPWMLSLTDDFKLEVRYNETYTPMGVVSYEVLGREKINGRDCFKVKVNDRYLWVDVEKRILVKSSTGEQLISSPE